MNFVKCKMDVKAIETWLDKYHPLLMSPVMIMLTYAFWTQSTDASLYQLSIMALLPLSRPRKVKRRAAVSEPLKPGHGPWGAIVKAD